MNWLSTSKVIVQGITEYRATLCALEMKAFGTKIVGGISPGNGGRTIEQIPIFDSVEQVRQVEQIDVSLIFVEPKRVLDAAREAIAAGIPRLIIFTSMVPPLDTIELIQQAKKTKTLVLGPGSSGILVPGQVWLGNLEPQYYLPGTVGLISSSRHLSYEVAAELNKVNLGQSIVVSLGSERIIGSNFAYWWSVLNEDPNTQAIVSIGHRINEIEEITAYSKEHGYHKPIAVYLAGLQAPQEKAYGDAVTIISNHLSASIPSVNRDIQALEQLKKLGIEVATRPSKIPALVSEALSAV